MKNKLKQSTGPNAVYLNYFHWYLSNSLASPNSISAAARNSDTTQPLDNRHHHQQQQQQQQQNSYQLATD